MGERGLSGVGRLDHLRGRMAYGVRLLVSGDFACFTRPEMKVERVSYDVMTPSAARGILEAIHWKPAIRWIVEAIHVLKPIRFQSIRRNEVGHKAPAASIRKAMNSGDIGDLVLLIDEDRQQRAATVLVDVAYVIEARFELTEKAGRRRQRGQASRFVQSPRPQGPMLSSTLPRDARVSGAVSPDRAGRGFAADDRRDARSRLHALRHRSRGRPSSLFFRARLDNGVMRVPAPEFPGDSPMSALASLVRAYERMRATRRRLVIRRKRSAF